MANVIIEGGFKTAFTEISNTAVQYYDAHYYKQGDSQMKIYREYDILSYGHDSINIESRAVDEFTGRYYVNNMWSDTPPNDTPPIDIPVDENNETGKKKNTTKDTASTTASQNANTSKGNMIYYILGGVMILAFVVGAYLKGWFKKQTP